MTQLEGEVGDVAGDGRVNRERRGQIEVTHEQFGVQHAMGLVWQWALLTVAARIERAWTDQVDRQIRSRRRRCCARRLCTHSFVRLRGGCEREDDDVDG